MWPLIVACTALAVVVGFVVYQVYRPDVFDYKTIDQIGKNAVKKCKTVEERVAYIIAELDKKYPGKIDKKPEWVMYHTGGAIGSFLILYASFTEYVMINGTSIGFHAFTGRNLVEFHDTVIDGEAWYFAEDKPLVRETYTEGDYCYMPRLVSAGTRFPDHGWLLEYARGNIPSLALFGFADVFFSTLDYVTFFKTNVVLTKNYMRSLFS